MNSYTIGSIVMIAVLVVFTCIVAGRLIYLAAKKETRAEFKNYIKTYKYGKFLWVYLLAIPLFAMSYHYSGFNGFDCFFKAFTSASKLMALQFDVSLELTKVNYLYQVAVILCYCIAILNVVLFVVSCLGQLIWNWFGEKRFKAFKNDKCLILGHDERCEAIYNSISKVNGSKVKKLMADVLNKSDKWDLYTKNIHYHGCADSAKLQKYIKKLLKKLISKYNKAFKETWKPNNDKHEKFPKLQIIINFKDQEDNANMCAYLSTLVKQYVEANKDKDVDEKKQLNCLPYLDVYIYGDSANKSLYSSYSLDYSGCLHFISDQEIIATDFIKKHPIAKYLTADQIEYKTSLLKKDVKVSISFVGFGRTQQELFKMIYSNTQFAKLKGKKLTGKCVDYSIYDLKETWKEKDFNETFNVYFNFIKKLGRKKSNYYPLPEVIKPNFEKFDIYSEEFNDISAKKIKEHSKTNDLKIIFISLKDDLASIEYANKLWNTIANDKIPNCHLFVKVDKKSTFENMSTIFNERVTPEHSTCEVYGCLTDTTLDYETIVMRDITKIAVMGDTVYSHSIYDFEPKDENDKILNFNEDIVEQARYKWTKDKEYNRLSSICSALNLRSKLLIMGLDYVKDDEKIKPKFDSFKKYWKFLDKKYSIVLSNETLSKQTDSLTNGVDYLRIELPTKSYGKTNSRRWALVFMEHNRWVAFNIALGWIPFEKSNLKIDDNGEPVCSDKTAKQHACLTTMEGLGEMYEDLFELYQENSNKVLDWEKNKCDKIQLDYLQFDAAWQFLKKIGYKIVAKDSIPKK